MAIRDALVQHIPQDDTITPAKVGESMCLETLQRDYHGKYSVDCRRFRYGP